MDFNQAVNKVKAKGVHINKQIRDKEVPGWGNTEQWVVIHYTGVHARKFAGIYNGGYGAKYSVDWDGNQYQHCSDGAKVWAVGTGGYYTQKHPYANNSTCVSIEMCCKCDGDKNDAGPDWWFTEETQIAAAALAAWLLKKKGYSVDHLLRHYDVVNKVCPAPYVHNNQHNGTWTWDFFRSVVKAVVEGRTEQKDFKKIKTSTDKKGLVTTDNLNVREVPPKGNIVKTLKKHTATYPMLRTDGAEFPSYWFKNEDGWYCGDYLTGWVCDEGRGWWYLKNGKCLYNTWQKIEGHWFYIGADGYRKTGWVDFGGTWYFFDRNGRMLSNQWAYNSMNKNYYWLKNDGVWDGKTIPDPRQWPVTEY